MSESCEHLESVQAGRVEVEVDNKHLKRLPSYAFPNRVISSWAIGETFWPQNRMHHLRCKGVHGEVSEGVVLSLEGSYFRSA